MDIDKMVNHKIAKLSGIIKRQIYQIISEEGLDITPEQWVILVYLWENDGQTIGGLVTQSQKDFANVTRIVEKLSKNWNILSSGKIIKMDGVFFYTAPIRSKQLCRI